MSWKLSQFGAEPKKLAILGALLLVAGYFYFSSRDSSSTVSATPAVVNTTVSGAAPRTAPRPVSKPRTADRSINSSPREFRPSMKAKDVDPSGIDPTLELDKLAKLREVQLEGGTRSLFEISNAPPAELVAIKEPVKIKPTPVGPVAPPPPPPPPEPPKAPPIPLKFYGFVNQSKAGDKRAFFLDGEDIVIATEGDMIKKRYKIVRIGINSATVEDTQFKTNSQQTLPLEAEVAG
jgi:hypothetical protein